MSAVHSQSPYVAMTVISANVEGLTASKTSIISNVQEQHCHCMIQCTLLALPCSLDDLNSFNDIAKRCVERWKTQV